MRFIVTLKLGSREQKVEKVDMGNYKVRVKARSVKGEANAEMIQVLAEYFNVKKTTVKIVIGKTAREKLVEVKK